MTVDEALQEFRHTSVAWYMYEQVTQADLDKARGDLLTAIRAEVERAVLAELSLVCNVSPEWAPTKANAILRRLPGGGEGRTEG